MFIPFVDVLMIFALYVLIIVTGVFLIAQLKRDNSVMDIFYGPTFFLAGLATLLSVKIENLLPYLILGAMLLWSTRLATRIYKKNRGQPEDARYAAWRADWSTHGVVYFILRSYLQINLLQGLIIVIVALPLLVSISAANTPISIFVFIGALVFALGLIIETIADYELDKFIARKKAGIEPENFMKTGLFRYSRRPNYFGESLIWWGLAIMVLPLPLGYWALLSPITITYIVTRVTGPMLEKIFVSRYGDAYKLYQNETSYFIPLPPKSTK